MSMIISYIGVLVFVGLTAFDTQKLKNMDIYKNKASGKFFIHVEDVDHGRAFFITPIGALKTLDLNLFDYQESMDEAHCLRRELITQLQVERYRQYFRFR